MAASLCKYIKTFKNILKIFIIVAFLPIFEYTINELITRRSSRLEYDERVCLTSASDGVL